MLFFFEFLVHDGMAEQVDCQEGDTRLGSGVPNSSLVNKLTCSLHQSLEDSGYLVVGHTDAIQDPAMTRLLTGSQAGNLRSEGIKKGSQETLRWVSLRRLDRVFGSMQQRHQLLQTRYTHATQAESVLVHRVEKQ